MTGRFTIWNKVAWILLSAVMSINVYRAATQSITIDEAFTYEQFVSKPFGGIFSPFDANNHVLNSVVSRLSIKALGVREFSLRLASLLGGAIYLFAAYRLSFLLFGGGAWSVVITALLTLNPFILDYLSAARGYGSALGFLLLGMYSEIRSLGEDRRAKPLYVTGLFFGLSIASNLTYIIPVAAFMSAILAADLARNRLHFEAFWYELLVPATLVSFVFWVVPLSNSKPENFYFGARKLADTIGSIADLSFAYRPPYWPAAIITTGMNLMRIAVPPFSLLLLGASIVCGAWYIFEFRRRGTSQMELCEIAACMFGITVCIIAGTLAVAHMIAGVPYPLTRTALYFVPLMVLTPSCLLYRFRSYKVVRAAAGAAGILCIVCFVLQLNVSYYAEWRFDCGSRRIVDVIRSKLPAGKRLAIRASWPLEPSLNFYRLRYKLNWDPIDRSGVEKAGDVIVLLPEDRGFISKLHLRVMYSDKASGVLVALPPQGTA